RAPQKRDFALRIRRFASLKSKSDDDAWILSDSAPKTTLALSGKRSEMKSVCGGFLMPKNEGVNKYLHRVELGKFK
ncbi:MAG: hypothetical protein IKT72_04865, partial [Clostridia bacterium]|nr:hypothetical protein [Clostridia bacterium]